MMTTANTTNSGKTSEPTNKSGDPRSYLSALSTSMEALEVTLDMLPSKDLPGHNGTGTGSGDRSGESEDLKDDDSKNIVSTDSESDSCDAEHVFDKKDSERMTGSTPSDCPSKDPAGGSCMATGWYWLKLLFSAALLGYCIAIVGVAIFQKKTTATGEKGLHPAAAFVIFWVLLLYLAQLEGGLNIMVGLKPVDHTLYQHSHPFTHGCTQLAHKGDNLDRFIVGRQYLDLTMVFTTSLMVSAVDGAVVLPGAPLASFLLHSGLAVTVVTIVIGQLVAIINSTHCMLEYVNNRVMLASTYLALIVEASGILHAVYFIQIVVGKLAGRSYQGSKVEPKTTFQTCTFWLRVLLSTSLLGFSIYITIEAILQGRTSVWNGVPPYASIILLVGLILIAGLMESLQIAFMAVVHMPSDELQRRQRPTAKRNYDFIFAKNNRLQAFLIGRQILQTVIMFVIARITTLDYKPEEPNLFGVSDPIQNIIFGSGVLATLMSTIIASLSWRVLANTFPLAFLAFPLSRFVIDLCLWTEATGVCSIAWPLATIHRSGLGWNKDEHYLGMRRLEDVDDAVLLMRPSLSLEPVMVANVHGDATGTEESGIDLCLSTSHTTDGTEQGNPDYEA